MEADLLGLNDSTKVSTTSHVPNKETALVVLSPHTQINQWAVTSPQQAQGREEDILLQFNNISQSELSPRQAHEDNDKEILLDLNDLQVVPSSQQQIIFSQQDDAKRATTEPHHCALSSPPDLVCLLSSRTDFTRSTAATTSTITVTSLLDDREFAPPPPLPTMDKLVRFEFMAEREADKSLLPIFDKVKHSGKILSRISIKSLITKQWKETFWVIYDQFQLIFFRNERDYEEWLLNPYLNWEERDKLIKLKIDLEKDLKVTGIRGYQITKTRKKQYRKGGIIHQFKVDSMTTYGPSLVGAFGSADINQTSQLYCLLREMLRRSPLNSRLLKMSNATIDGREQEYLPNKKMSMSKSFASPPSIKPKG